MTITADRAGASPGVGVTLRSPLVVLALVLLAVPLLLALPLKLPIGAMYWDVIVYYDGAQRIHLGQVPVRDFFTPVGPLGYYLFAGWLWLFPNAQPTLIAHWALLPVTAPLLAVVVAKVQQRSRATAFALIVPFLIFALLPFNTREYYPYPGSDGFGIYNRQVCQLLYVMVAAPLFLREGRQLGLIVAAAMTALFFLKITGFVSGAIICLFAFACGRLTFRAAAGAALGFLGVLAVLEFAAGLVSIYLRDILELVEMNSSGLASRFLQAGSHTAGILLPSLALAALLLWTDRQRLREKIAAARGASGMMAVLDHHAFWLGAVLFAGIFFETQNTGSQAMIFVWPVILVVLTRSMHLMVKPKLLIAVLGLAAAAALPPAINIMERAARTYGGSIKNIPLESRNLRALGAVTMRGDVEARALLMETFYPKHRAAFEELSTYSQLPSFVLYSDFDFQILHLREIDKAIDSIRKLEADKGVRFDTIMALNFVNPFPWLMDRDAPRLIAIGADPTRAVPPPDGDVLQAVRDADLIVRPMCPVTSSNRKLYDLYAPAMTAHRHIALNDCYEAWVNPRLAGELD